MWGKPLAADSTPSMDWHFSIWLGKCCCFINWAFANENMQKSNEICFIKYRIGRITCVNRFAVQSAQNVAAGDCVGEGWRVRTEVGEPTIAAAAANIFPVHLPRPRLWTLALWLCPIGNAKKLCTKARTDRRLAGKSKWIPPHASPPIFPIFIKRKWMVMLLLLATSTRWLWPEGDEKRYGNSFDFPTTVPVQSGRFNCRLQATPPTGKGHSLLFLCSELFYV